MLSFRFCIHRVTNAAFLNRGISVSTKTRVGLNFLPVPSVLEKHTNSIFGCVEIKRSTSFFTQLTADQLWKSCTSVSNAGRKRGRGKASGKKMKKNLNKGQVLGVGPSNMIWPGLNSPIIKGREIVEQKQLPTDEDRNTRLAKIRDEQHTFRRMKLLPLERGWTGAKMPGRSVGPPDPVGEETFQNFDTKVIEMKMVFSMSGNFGRTRRMSAFVVTGNKNGVAGYALAKAADPRAAIRKAKNQAAQKLMYIERFQDSGVHHNFYAQYGRAKLFVEKKPKGYGLVCHRALKVVCELLGITDLYAKSEGSRNIQNITKAFFMGLLNQKLHKDIADEKGLHVVELNPANDNYPTVIASPTICRKPEEIKKYESLNYDEYISQGKVKLQRKKFPPFYTKLPGWQLHLKKTVRFRNHEQVKVNLVGRYGKLISFVNPNEIRKFPLSDR